MKAHLTVLTPPAQPQLVDAIGGADIQLVRALPRPRQQKRRGLGLALRLAAVPALVAVLLTFALGYALPNEGAGRLTAVLGLAAAAGAFALVLFLAAYVSSEIVSPAHRLGEAMNRVAKGDLTARVPEGGAGEVGALAHAFNGMMVMLEASRTLEKAWRVELAAVLDSTTDGICMVDTNGTLAFANASLARFWRDLGLEGEGHVWEHLGRIAARSERPEEHVADLTRLASDPEAVYAGEFRMPDGRSFTAYTAPVRDPSDELLGRILSLRETTAEREAARTKDEFVATVSHELRTPLTSIMGYAALLRRGRAGNLQPEQLDLLEVLERNAERLLRLVNDLLFVSLAEAGRLVIERIPVDMDTLVSGRVKESEAAARAAGVELRVQCEPGLAVLGDRGRLEQLVDNLLSNAIKFTPAGGRVSVRAFTNGAARVVEVEDTGIGIPERDQRELFARFYRASNAVVREIQGTGIGLSIVRMIAELHGGTVECRSSVGVGTLFVVTIPVSDEGARAA